jgi:hypothetical protein
MSGESPPVSAAGNAPSALPAAPAFARDRLHARFDAAGAAPLTLVVAGAGSGKSTAVREYAALRGLAPVWFALEPEHRDPVALLRGFAAAFADAAPGLALTVASAEAALAAGNEPALRAWVLDGLAGLSGSAVLDGVQYALADPRGTAFVRDLVDATVPDWRWFLVSRDVAALPVARWLAGGVTRLPVDENDLRVDLAELRAAAAGRGFDEAALRRLHERSAGWPLGLAVALAGGAGALDGKDTAGDRERTYDRVLDAALAAQSDPELLLRIALLERFDAAALAALGPSPAQAEAVLAGLAADGLIAPVGRDRYAFGEPYRIRLRARLDDLGEQRRAALYERAAAALEGLGRWSDGLALRVRAGDPGAIVLALERRGFLALDQGDVELVRGALALLPDDAAVSGPTGLAMKAAIASLDERFDVAEAWFRIAIDAVDGDRRNEIVIRYGLDLVRRGRTDVSDMLEAELARPGLTEANAAALWGLLGTAYVGVHRLREALGASAEALARVGSVEDDAIRARIFHQAAYVALNNGEYAAARDHALHALADAERVALHDLAARALSVLHNVAILADDDAAAARGYLVRLAEAARRSGSTTLRLYATLNLIELAVDAGDGAAIERLDAELRELQVLLTPMVSESLLPAQALRAAWDGRFEHAYALLAPSADKQFDDDRRGLRYAECAVYAAAAGMRSESVAAARAARTALRALDPHDRLTLRARANLALAEILLGRNARAAATLAALRASAETGPRVAALLAVMEVLYERWTGGWYGPLSLADALERLEAVELGGIARFVAALTLPEPDRDPAQLT